MAQMTAETTAQIKIYKKRGEKNNNNNNINNRGALLVLLVEVMANGYVLKQEEM